MALLEFTEAFKTKKQAKLKSVPNRKPLVIKIAEILAVLYVGLSRYILPVLGFGSLTTAAFLQDTRLGFVALGISLLIFDYGKGSK